MISLRSALGHLTFACCVAVVGLSPWLFAAWEVWWFWPFVILLFLGWLSFSLRLLFRHSSASSPSGSDAGGADRCSPWNGRLAILTVLSFAPFLLYGAVRWWYAEVFADGERSFLLFLSPFLLGNMIVFGFTVRQRTLLYWIILADLALLGIYGIVNHLITGSAYVLWMPGYSNYTSEHRLTGTYFCPDHFAGIMEIAFCLTLGILLARDGAWKRKILAAVLAALALLIVVLSKSRGGGLTVLVVAAAALAWGFVQWPARARWGWRVTVVSLAALVLLAFCGVETAYMARFKEHFGGSQGHGKSFQEQRAIVAQALLTSCRGRMYAGALRAWRTEPVFGIGPGMHQNLWPHFAPSPDGDREEGIWPTMPNYDFHSYEVHSDWIQLLEEYGVIGLLLFLMPVSAVLGVLLVGLYREEGRWKREDWRGRSSPGFALILGGLLAGVAMAFHSFGDFNLQMPATVWLLAAVLAVSVAAVLRPRETEG